MFFMNVCVWAMYVYKCILLFFFLYLQLPEPFFVLCCHLARQRIKNIEKREIHTAHGSLSWAQHIAVSLRVCDCFCVFVCIAISKTNTLNTKSSSENIYKQELKTKDESAFCELCMCEFGLWEAISLIFESNIESFVSSLLSHSLAWKANGNFSGHNGERAKKCTQRHSWQSS